MSCPYERNGGCRHTRLTSFDYAQARRVMVELVFTEITLNSDSEQAIS